MSGRKNLSKGITLRVINPSHGRESMEKSVAEKIFERIDITLTGADLATAIRNEITYLSGDFDGARVYFSVLMMVRGLRGNLDDTIKMTIEENDLLDAGVDVTVDSHQNEEGVADSMRRNELLQNRINNSSVPPPLSDGTNG